ncbi:hypothetical protein OEZ86_007872 [Tetradesmus obliquus]|nr:hypothetical protein OEZ86_007872 [Tetradesmus obliquus]
MAATAVFVLWSEDTEPPSRAMTDVVASPVAGLTSADSAGEETEHSLLSATSAGEEGSDGDTSGPAGAAGKPTDHAEVMPAVKKQVEFYFSDANLPTDKHLLKQIQKDAEGYVPLRMIANFKRVKALTKELTVVAEALRSSSLLSLDAEGTRVRRAAPLPAFDVGDITRRTVVVEHLPDKPTIESVTQLLAQYGRVVMVRICSRGNTSKLPAWLAKAVESINVTMAPGEFALVEFGSEEDCVACVTKTKNPDNWRTSLRVRHLLTNFKPSTKASSSSSGARPRSSLDHGSRHEAEAAGHHGKPHGREREHSGTGDGRRTTSSRRSSHDGAKRASHDGYSQQQQHRDERAGSSAAAAAAADLPVHLSPIRTHAADAAAQQQQRSASPYANGAARMNGVVSPSPALSPVRTGTSGVGGSIGSPRTVPSPAPAAVTSFIDSILSAPTASTPTRDARSSAGGEAGSSSTQQRRRSSHTGHDAGSSSRDAGEEQDDEHEDGEHDHDSEHGKRRRRRHRGSGSRRASLDESHPGGSRRQSLDEGSRGGSRRQSLDESGGRYGGSSSSRPGSRAGAPSPLEDAAAAGQHAHGQHSRPHSSCSAGGGKPHSHHGSPSPASHMPGERRGSHDGSAAAAKEAGSKKKEKKDYASWAAATPEFRAAAAAVKHSGGGNGNSSSSSAALGSSPARAGLSPMRASGGGGSVASGHDGDSHVRIARMPDGSRGFGMGRGRALTPPPQ